MLFAKFRIFIVKSLLKINLFFALLKLKVVDRKVYRKVWKSLKEKRGFPFVRIRSGTWMKWVTCYLCWKLKICFELETFGFFEEFPRKFHVMSLKTNEKLRLMIIVEFPQSEHWAIFNNRSLNSRKIQQKSQLKKTTRGSRMFEIFPIVWIDHQKTIKNI